MPTNFDTKLVTLILEAQDSETIVTIDIPVDIMTGEPPVFIAFAAHPHDIQLVRETLGTIWESHGLVRRFPSHTTNYPAHVAVTNICNTALRAERVLFAYFDAWQHQDQNASLVVCAVGARHVETVKGFLSPILEAEEREHREKLIRDGRDLPPLETTEGGH